MGKLKKKSSSSSNSEEEEAVIMEIGEKLLENPPNLTSKDALLKLLKRAATCLSQLDQSPSPSMLESMRSCLTAIANPEMLKHQDRDVMLLVATCVCQIMRITAPEPPYSDHILRDIFRLIVATFSGLADPSSPSFGRRVVILETLARYRSCVVILDLQCQHLVNQMFTTFFAIASDDQPDNVLTSMQTIMILLIEESEDIEESLLHIILNVLGRAKSDVSMAARRLAMNVIGHCAGKLESSIKQFLISCMSGDNIALNMQLNHHEVIYDTYRCAPQILSAVIPYLTGELLADEIHTRLKAAKLLGDLFALPDAIYESFQPIFSEFLKRLTDRAVEVRMSVVEHVKLCLLSNPSRAEAPIIIASLRDRLLDYDENVRKLVVAAICDVACAALKSISVETLKLVADRLRDKTFLVKRYTMERIAEVYRIYCLKYSDGSINTNDFEWIPGKILRCLYDRDFRSETIEFVLCGSLFPMESTTKDRLTHWVTAYNGFDKVEVKALEKVLEQKQRLQLEMKKYLSCRQMHQDGEASELQKKILVAFRVMSRWFIDPAKAEENFQILDQLKDANVWKILLNLSDPNTSFLQTMKFRDDLLKILGERHPLYNFLDTLSLKCSYVPFDKECVKELLLKITTHSSEGTQYVRSCMNLLAMLARFSPALLSGTECDLVSYLKEDDDILKEGALHILARAGGTIREHLAVVSSPVDLILERLCVEGSRKQAKYAVHALASITIDDGLKSLSVLYKRLVDMLADGSHLPAILQSLGSIAQIAMPIFETREGEIIAFIKSNILNCSTKEEDRSKINWGEKSEVCLLKIFGMKTLVKSYMPAKDAHLRVGVEDLLTMIKNTLSTGEVFSHVESSPVDKAHMKLASAKAVLRLSKQWDHKIPINVFHLTLRTSENCYPEARQQFLSKVYQYVKDKLLDVKFACAFVHGIDRTLPLEFKEYKHNLAEVIQMCFQAKARPHPMQCDANPLMIYPEYILPYLVHSVAHHPSFPDIHECSDVGPFEIIYRRLHLFLSLLMHGDEDGESEIINCKGKESISAIISIFHSIIHSEDTVDMTKSKNSHAVCEIGLSIIKDLSRDQVHLTGLATSVPLPSTLYKPLEKKDTNISVTHCDRTWLARDVVLAHLESLKLEPAGAVAKVEKFVNDNDGDDNNVPLGQMIKGFRSEGPRTKKNRKEKVLVAETKNLDNDFDILGVVRDINLHGLERSKIIESGNDHGYIRCEEADDQDTADKVLVSEKSRTVESTSLASLRKKRSSFTQGVQKSPQTVSYSKGIVTVSENSSRLAASSEFNDPEKVIDTDVTDKVSLVEDLAPVGVGFLSSDLTNKSFLSKRKVKGASHQSSKTIRITGGAGDTEVEVSNVQERCEQDNSNSKSSELIKKRKRSVVGLSKCSLKENHSLVGSRIKVWWPLDKKFYEGLVQSYDPKMEKHEILYEDGELEFLHLGKEQWVPVTKSQNPRQQLKSQDVSPTKGIRNNCTPRNQLQQKKSNKKSSSSKVKGTQAANSEVGMDIDSSDAESKDVSDLPDFQPVQPSKVGHAYSGDCQMSEQHDKDDDHDHDLNDEEPLGVWKHRHSGKGIAAA